MEKDDYDKLLTENITKTYKKSSTAKVDKININAKSITEDLSFEDHVEKMYENGTYTPLKTI